MNSAGSVARSIRVMHLTLGLLFVALAILGSVLPLLPTTPFLILASNSFARSSPAWRAWLLRIPIWGNAVRDWEQSRAVRPQTKRIAYGMIGVSVITSTFMCQENPRSLGIMIVVAVVAGTVVARIPVLPTAKYGVPTS